MSHEADAVYHGHAFDYVDTRHAPIAQALFLGALKDASMQGDPHPALATGSLQSEVGVAMLLGATGSTESHACWSPAEVQRHLTSANWPQLDTLEEPIRSEVLTAQFFLQACAAGGYGIQFGSE